MWIFFSQTGTHRFAIPPRTRSKVNLGIAEFVRVISPVSIRKIFNFFGRKYPNHMISYLPPKALAHVARMQLIRIPLKIKHDLNYAADKSQ